MIFGKPYTKEKRTELMNKTRYKFAWLPIRLVNGQWAWLEWVIAEFFCSCTDLTGYWQYSHRRYGKI